MDRSKIFYPKIASSMGHLLVGKRTILAYGLAYIGILGINLICLSRKTADYLDKNKFYS